MKHVLKMVAFLLAISLVTGCDALPEGPVTPDGYRPPEPTQENIKNMVRNAINNMIFIEGGSYVMGNVICFDGDRDENVKKWQIELIFCRTNESPLHKVTLNSFLLNKYEISFYEYDLFTQATHRPFIQERYLDPEWWRSRDKTMEAAIERFSKTRTGELPAAIDWFQASDYCRWLGAVTNLPIELPTEAEWEYAARNRGQDFPYATDNGRIDLGRNYPQRDDDSHLPVDSFPPNPLGLHHMSYNVMEWVSDWYDENFYKRSPENNPQGPHDGSRKVLRGGITGNKPSFNHNFGRVDKDIDYSHEITWYKDLNITEGSASFSHGARCAIHISRPLDINKLKIDLSKPAPDSRAEWLATKAQGTEGNEHAQK